MLETRNTVYIHTDRMQHSKHNKRKENKTKKEAKRYTKTCEKRRRVLEERYCAFSRATCENPKPLVRKETGEDFFSCCC